MPTFENPQMSKSLEDLQRSAAELVVKLMNQDPENAQLGFIITQFGSLIPQQIYPLWMDNTKQLKEFLVDALPFEFCSCESENEIPDEIHQMVASLDDSDPPKLSDANIQELNALMNDAQLRWIGTFNQLCNGESEVSQEVICLFRNNQNYQKPIQKDERKDFKDFLLEGIH